MAGSGRKDNAEVLGSVGVHTDIVEAVGDVDLREVDRTPARVGPVDLEQDAPQGPAKLHGFRVGEVDRRPVDSPEGEVGDGPRASIGLGHDAGRTDLHTSQMLDGTDSGSGYGTVSKISVMTPPLTTLAPPSMLRMLPTDRLDPFSQPTLNDNVNSNKFKKSTSSVAMLT